MFIPSPGKKVLRRMGFFSDQRGLLNRYFRESEEWKQHLENTSEFIITCLRNKGIKELIVLGSGWLLDFPLNELSRETEHIYLVDIIHPPQIIKKIKNFPGVECISADITGGYVEKFYNEIKSIRSSSDPFIFEPGIIRPDLKRTEDSFVISLNILNQIDSFLIDYIKEKTSADEKTILRIRNKIQTDHINVLTSGRYILITDYEELIINSKNQDRTIKNLLSIELPVSQYIKEWQWMFDSQGTYNRGNQTILKIRAMCSESPIIQ
jgi:hypothetical protein